MVNGHIVVANCACGDVRGTSYSMMETLRRDLPNPMIMDLAEFCPYSVLIGCQGRQRKLIYLDRIREAVELGANMISLAAHEDCEGYHMNFDSAMYDIPHAFEAIRKHLSGANLPIEASDIRYLGYYQRKNGNTFNCNVRVFDSAQPKGWVMEAVG